MASVPFSEYPRDLAGYGRHPPDPRWPGKARVAVQFVVNFEEGGENMHPARRRGTPKRFSPTFSARSHGPASAT